MESKERNIDTIRPSDTELAAIRDRVAELQRSVGGPVPHNLLVELARSISGSELVTVDFAAVDVLGAPMILVQSGASEPHCDPFPMLSPRERDVVALITEGLANKQIAVSLNLSLATVKDHVHRILVKTGLPNRAAVAAAMRPTRR
jgi:DNA-binding NarL/FixJ family response regulator